MTTALLWTARIVLAVCVVIVVAFVVDRALGPDDGEEGEP